MTRIVARLVVCSLILASLSSHALADGTVTGHARFQKIKGQPQAGFVELYESNLFLCRDGGGTLGPSARLGAPQGQGPRHDGYYSLSVPAGTWSLLVNQPLFFIRPKVLAGVTVTDGQTTTQHVELAIDYSTYFKNAWTSWDSVWVQTFVATGAGIAGVSWVLAGTNAERIEVSIHRDDGTANPVEWPLVSSASRRADDVGVLGDNWVRWLSGEVPTEPGQRYAVKLSGVSGGDRKYAVCSRAKDANSYADGRAYSSSGAAQNFDLNITVFSDNDATAILYNKRTEGLGDLKDGFYAGRWGQTFKATTGTSLAAVDVWAAGGDNQWDLDFTFRVREGGPTGPQVGPVKTTKAAYQAFGAGLHGVSYSPGEVPLEPGETYYVEFNSPGFNPYVVPESIDAYPHGAAYQDGLLKNGGAVDLSMTIVVHTEPGGHVRGRVTEATSGDPVVAARVEVEELARGVLTGADGRYEIREVPEGTFTVRASKAGFSSDTTRNVVVVTGDTVAVDLELELEDCSANFRNGSFESGLTGWQRFGEAKTDVPTGGWFGDIHAYDGNSFQGNAVNGGSLARGGLWQRACAFPGHRIRAIAWSNIYWIGGSSSVARARIGLDPGGGTDPDGPVEWGSWDRQTREATEGWRELSVEAEATGPVVTVFLEFRQTGSGDIWRINCFDHVQIEDVQGPVGPEFIRGDCDSGQVVNITDAIFLLGHLFQGDLAPTCPNACDVNDDESLNVSDGVFLLNWLFGGGAPPPAPHDMCGVDSTPGDLECLESGC